jgi:hypothetical protein
MNHRILEIQKAILEIENPYPKDDLITCYKDFLKVRNYLPYYKFNLNVFKSLINLTCKLWNSKERISRISLLESIKRYGYNTIEGRGFSTIEAKSSNMPFEINIRTFSLFKNCFENPHWLSEKQIDEARKICNKLLINIRLESNDISWLCSNVEKSDLILNRILRYPAKSEIISNWAIKNYTQDKYRNRRAELVGWLIDQNPFFEVEKQTLIDDFEHSNMLDKEIIQNYENELEAQKVIERDLNGILSPQQNQLIYFGVDIGKQESIVSSPKLQLTKRLYKTTPDFSKHYDAYVPDYEIMNEQFHSNIDLTYKITMLWSIAYSRIEIGIKSELLKKYYSNDTYYSFIKICKRLKMKGLLEWLKDEK